MQQKNRSFQGVAWPRRVTGWLVHLFTASGACVGLAALWAIYRQQHVLAFWLMGTAIVIDAVDGMFARFIKIKEVVPEIDGALLDNIVDFFTYVMVPAFFVLTAPLVPEGWHFPCAIMMALSSAYQFTQVDAKTHDHFFKGFPSYWNIVVFYLFFWQMSLWVNWAILATLALLSFVPIKYIYPSRLDYLTHSKMLRFAMLFATIVWGMATAGLLWIYPHSNTILVGLSMGYIVFYVGMSLYRTWVPLTMVSVEKIEHIETVTDSLPAPNP